MSAYYKNLDWLCGTGSMLNILKMEKPEFYSLYKINPEKNLTQLKRTQ